MISTAGVRISDLVHPEYRAFTLKWRKWRLTYEGGDDFIRNYLRRISKREDPNDFLERLYLTYCPAFAKAAINDVKNSIFQRLIDITREGGSSSYQSCVKGELGGVDLLGSSMSSFIGRRVLPELLTMGKVGVFVDMTPPPGPTLADKGDLHPYVYIYRTEDFRNWCEDQSPTRNEYSAILLYDITYTYDDNTGLPIGYVGQYRYMWIADDGFVHVKYYDDNGQVIFDANPYYDFDVEGEITLNIRRIPFYCFQLTGSLLEDVSNYQIALLNLNSSDIMYAIKANFPFYTEQYDPRIQSPYIKTERPEAPSFVQETFGNSQIAVNPIPVQAVKEIHVSTSAGRAYPINTERPGFINPSPDPLKVSMELSEKLKAEIRQLINLAITNLQPKMASAESKKMDNTSLEAGLSYIGLELENGERKIAEFWSIYENSKTATVNYPENYSLTGQEERHDKAESLKDLMPDVPSLTYQREIAKQIAKIMVGSDVSSDIVHKIENEIDIAPVVVGDPKVIDLDLKNGLVSTETASIARGYPPGEVEKAKEDHAERIARIAVAQTAQARGVPDLGANPQAGIQEKAASRETTTMPTPEDTTRGEGK